MYQSPRRRAHLAPQLALWLVLALALLHVADDIDAQAKLTK